MNNNSSAVDCIKQYINEVGNNAEMIISQRLGLVKEGTKYRCPDVMNHKNGDKHPSLSWNSTKFFFKCFTGNCNFQLNIYTYYKEYENKNFMEIIPEHIRKNNSNEKNKVAATSKVEIKKFILNKDDLQPVLKKDKDYLMSRGICENTIKDFKICSTKFTYQRDKKTNEYKRVKNEYPAFVYFNNKMQVSGIKFRGGWEHCKYASFPESKFTLFGRHLCNRDNKELIIVEGEIDCMIAKQNFNNKNFVSVPTGAGSLEQLFEREKDFFNQFNRLIICPDNDKAGKEMLLKFDNKFGKKVSCIDFKRYKGEKDINDLFIKYGFDGLNSLIRTTISHDIEDMGDYDVEPEDNYFLDTGYETLDNMLNGIMGGTMTIVGGSTGSGKTTFVESFINKVIGEGHKVLRIDGEHRKKQLVYNTYLKLLSNIKNSKDLTKTVKIHRKKKLFPTEKGNRLCKAWAKNKSFFYSVADIPPQDRLNNEQLFKVIEKAVRYDSVPIVIIDNLMSINNEMEDGDQYEQQKIFVQRCQSLAKAYNVAVVLVCHTKKTPQDGKMNEYSLFGSSKVPSYADNIFFLRKANDVDREKYHFNVGGMIEVFKNREESETGEIPLIFDSQTKMLYEIDFSEKVPRTILIDFGLTEIMSKKKIEEIENRESDSLLSELGLEGLIDE